MKRLYVTLLTLSPLLFSDCNTTAKLETEVQIVCPADVTVVIPTISAPRDTLPAPVLSTDCTKGEASYTIAQGLPLKTGTNSVVYEASTPCGDRASCSFMVEGLVDFRSKFVGTYAGYRDCAAYNTSQLHPDQSMTFTVGYGDAPDRLLVGSDQVPVDANGSFPGAYLGSYRTYGLSFRGDSIFIQQQWGALNSNETCQFRGKRQ